MVISSNDRDYLRVGNEDMPTKLNIRTLIGVLVQRTRDMNDELLAAFLLMLPSISSPLEVLSILEDCVMEARRGIETTGIHH